MLSCGSDDQAWLIRTPGSRKETQTFINPLKGSIEERKIPEMEGQLCLAHFEDWLFLVRDLSDECFLLNIYSLQKIHLPPIEVSFESLGLCILTSSPTSPYCTIIFLGQEDNFLQFCRPGDKEWTEVPVDFDVTDVTRMLMYRGKLYVMLLNSIEIIDITSLSTATTTYLTTISMDKPDQFFSFGIGEIGHLVESCGDLFFVRTCFPSTIQTVIDLVIFKLDFSNEDETETWVRVESIGDCAFFLDSHGGQSFHAQDARVDRNCVYQMLSCYDGERLYKICLDNQTISFKLLSEEAIQGQYYCSFNWLLPVRFLKIAHNW
ncbi:F-box protein At2g14290-like [Carex rostrata]